MGRYKWALVMGVVVLVLGTTYISTPIVYRTDTTPSIVVAVNYPYSGCRVRPILGILIGASVTPQLPVIYRTEVVSTMWNAPLSCFPPSARPQVISARKLIVKENREMRKLGY